MQVILVQAEIEQALTNYVNDMIAVKEGMEIKVDLKATRGADGATAVVDIVPKAVTPTKTSPIKPTPRGGLSLPVAVKKEEVAKGNPVKEEAQPDLPVDPIKSDDPAAADEAGPASNSDAQAGSEQQAEDKPAEPDPAPVADAPKKSLFSNLKRANAAE